VTIWSSDAAHPVEPKPGPLGLLRLVLRGLVLGLVVITGLLLLLLVRVVEAPLAAPGRPVSPWITQGVCRLAFVILRLPVSHRGARMTGPGAIVANHASWLDVFALNSGDRVYFIAKAEVAGWPLIGWLARATGTLFVARDRSAAKAQAALFRDRLMAGHRLLFFPEGTSTDGQRVLAFKTTLFEAFFDDALRHNMQVQPVTLIYHPPPGEDVRTYGWWGDMSFGGHLLGVLARGRQGRVEVIWHRPLPVDGFPNRKTLARALEAVVRGAHPQGRSEVGGGGTG